MIKPLPSPDGVSRKQCKGCTKLLYLERFGRDTQELDGYSAICLSCEDQLEDLKFCEDVHGMIRTMDSQALRVLEHAATKSTKGAAGMISLPHAATILEDIMNVWGGSQGYAHHLMAEYLAAKPGSQLRQSTLKAILGLVKFVSEQNYVSQPLETMTDDQLEEHYRMQQAQLQKKLGVFDGKESGESAAG